MKKIKITIDIIMTIFMMLLMSTDITGVPIHEVMGIGLFGLFITHIALNFKWVKAISKKIFKRGIKTKTRVMYGIDVLLFPLIIANVVSGILISTTVLTGISVTNTALASQWHHFFAYWLLAVLVVHLGLHWNMIRSAAKIKEKSVTGKLTAGIVSACVLGVMFKVDAFSQMKIPTDNTESTYIASTTTISEEETDTQREETVQTSSSEPGESQPTIEEFLSNLFCNACGKHCPLTSPQCGKGVNQQQEQVQDYNDTYQTTEVYNSETSGINRGR